MIHWAFLIAAFFAGMFTLLAILGLFSGGRKDREMKARMLLRRVCLKCNTPLPADLFKEIDEFLMD